MKTSLSPAKVTKRTQHQVIASFTNGFAQDVIELDNGMRLFISYGGESVTIEHTEPITDPQQITDIINNTPVDEVQECKDSGEHFKRVLPENGYDVCFNCGAKDR